MPGVPETKLPVQFHHILLFFVHSLFLINLKIINTTIEKSNKNFYLETKTMQSGSTDNRNVVEDWENREFIMQITDLSQKFVNGLNRIGNKFKL